jgi:hypothetical protein
MSSSFNGLVLGCADFDQAVKPFIDCRTRHGNQESQFSGVTFENGRNVRGSPNGTGSIGHKPSQLSKMQN